MKRVLILASTVTLAIVLVLGLALPGLAAGDDEETDEAQCLPWHRVLRGVVYSVDEDDQEFFTIKDGEVTIWVNEATRYFKVNAPRRVVTQLRNEDRLTEAEGQQETQILESRQRIQLQDMEQGFSPEKVRTFRQTTPMLAENRQVNLDLSSVDLANGEPKELQGNLSWLRRFGQEATFEDIDPGDKVVAYVVPRNGEPLAKVVLIIEPSPYERVIGEILSIDLDEQLIVIEPTSGTENTQMELYYDEDTVFLLHLRGTPCLERGMKALFIYEEDGNGDFLAKRVIARMGE